MACPTSTPSRPGKNRSVVAFIFLLSLSLFFLYCFISLGIWQSHRLVWKRDLIKQVETRIHLEPQTAPSASSLKPQDLDNYNYLPIKIKGQFFANKAIFITAMNDEASGFWWMAPLLRENGEIIFINRGFISQDQYLARNFAKINQQAASPALETEPRQIIGLLRLSEKNRFFLNKNNIAQNSWYQRNISDMAQALKLDNKRIAPYFIDAFSISGQDIGKLGLTKIDFPNNHLSYAITWFTLALFTIGAIIYLCYERFFKKAK